jgi:thiosulfate/3-mercaptopyruvate sulfurtransferase
MLSLCSALVLLSLSAEAGYPRPELLAEPAELRKADPARPVCILDARGKGQYKEGHIPGAVWVDALTWGRAFGDGKDADSWQSRIGGLGITRDTPVIVYDEAVTPTAARVWWILRYWGIRDVRLLNGGWKGWLAADGKVQKEEQKPAARMSKLEPQRHRLATRDDVLARVKDHGAQIVDTRSLDEYCGLAETAKRNGSIPSAKHLEWSDLVDKKSGRFKSAEELRKLLQTAGIDPAKPAVTYCQSGGRAAVMALALELLGGKETSNYYGSWADWGNAEDTPIVKPAKK